MHRPIICSLHESHHKFEWPEFEKSVRIRFGAVKEYRKKDIDFPCVKAIAKTKDKVKMKEVLVKAGIKTPDIVLLPNKHNLPLIFKEFDHSQGRGMKILDSLDKVYQNYGKGYYEAFKRSNREFRVHICLDRPFHIDEKILKSYVKTRNLIKNSTNGYVYLKPEEEVPYDVIKQSIKAVQAMKLDFGAVDVGYNQEGAWVYEVNTAVGMRTRTREKYNEMLIELIELKIRNL